jgi:hypothetical protein
MDELRQIELPPAARALSTLAHIDYEDAFLIETERAQDKTAEEWARSILEGAPVKLRAMLTSGWTAIGLKLGRGDRYVLGWEIRASTPGFVLLGADSRLGMPAQLLFKREPGALLFATFVQHDNQVARAVWVGTEPVHVPTVRHVLEQARRRPDGPGRRRLAAPIT